jgi:hypothetical protein
MAWPNGQTINTADSTSLSPASCLFKNEVYVFWKANDPSNRIFFSAARVTAAKEAETLRA